MFFHSLLILSLSKDAAAKETQALKVLFIIALSLVMATRIHILRQAQDEGRVEG